MYYLPQKFPEFVDAAATAKTISRQKNVVVKLSRESSGPYESGCESYSSGEVWRLATYENIGPQGLTAGCTGLDDPTERLAPKLETELQQDPPEPDHNERDSLYWEDDEDRRRSLFDYDYDSELPLLMAEIHGDRDDYARSEDDGWFYDD